MRARLYECARAIQSDFDPDVTRAIERLTPIMDRDLDSDRRFFNRLASRNYRLRRAFASERRALEILEPQWAAPFSSHTLFVAVRQVRPGRRLRIPIWGPSHTKTDLDDAAAQAVFHAVRSPQASTITTYFGSMGRP